MGDTSSDDTNWIAIALGVMALAGFVASFYITPRRIDFQWVMTKHVLRWETPVFAVFMFAWSRDPSETVLYAGIAAFFIASGIGSWLAIREGKELERQGKLAKDDEKQ